MSATQENLSLVLHPSKELTLEKNPRPKPKDNELLIAINSTGICGTDIHLWSSGEVANLKLNTPTVIGHESSGTVIEVGKDVKNFKIGDRVAIDTSIPCLKCSYCLEGNNHLCPNLLCLGLPPCNGTYSRYITHSATFCFKIPDQMSYEEGALIEPLAITVHACRRGGVTGGDKILICGAGPIGLLTMLTARAFGATDICITDIRQDRIDFAKKLGANHILLTKDDAVTCSQKIKELMGTQPDKTFDCCGFEETLKTALLTTKPRGKVIVVGLGHNEVKLPLTNALYKEIDIIGVNRSPNTYPKTISLVASGIINVRPLISHRFKLEDAIEALKFVKEGKPGVFKVMIQCQN